MCRFRHAFALCLLIAAVSVPMSLRPDALSAQGTTQTTTPTPIPECTVWRDEPTDAIEPDECTYSHPWWTVWDNCPITPIHTERFQSETLRDRGLEGIPWVVAEPASAGIVGHLFYGNRPLHTDGYFPADKMNAKVLWQFEQPVHDLTIKAVDLWREMEPIVLVDPATYGPNTEGDWPTLIDIPTAGCWEATLTAVNEDGAQVVGRVTFIVVGD